MSTAVSLLFPKPGRGLSSYIRTTADHMQTIKSCLTFLRPVVPVAVIATTATNICSRPAFRTPPTARRTHKKSHTADRGGRKSMSPSPKTPAASRPPKTCATCGRQITWRKKWERDWDNIKHCSTRCRSNRPGEQGRFLEDEILRMLHDRKTGATICPSEVSRALFADNGEQAWRGEMETVRQAARRLVAQGAIQIVQKGQVVDPSRAKGPIRLRLV